MDELIVENFFKQHQHERQIHRDSDERLRNAAMSSQDSVNIQIDDQKTTSKNTDIMLDMGIYLRRLEIEIEREYADFADYRFIFNRIRTAFKQNSVEGVIEQLDHLEELLDLGIPSLIMKKNI